MMRLVETSMLKTVQQQACSRRDYVPAGTTPSQQNYFGLANINHQDGYQ